MGDTTGSIIFTGKTEEQCALLTTGTGLVLRNIKVHMYRGHMRLGVDMWGVMERASVQQLEEAGLAQGLDFDHLPSASSTEYRQITLADE